MTVCRILSRGSLWPDWRMGVTRNCEAGKLVKLKSWLTLYESAEYLSALIDEPISKCDLLRLALDRHITVSVRFVNAVKANRGRRVPLAEAPLTRIPSLDGKGIVEVYGGTRLGQSEVILWDEEVATLQGVWDLPMYGGEALDVECEYQLLRQAPEVTMLCIEGTFVIGADGTLYRLLERRHLEEKSGKERLEQLLAGDRLIPCGGLPEDCEYVFRRTAIEQFAETLRGEGSVQPERPLATKERGTLLVIVGALARMAKLDIVKVSKAAAAIEAQTIVMGARIAPRTIEEHLKRIPEALEDRAA